MRNTIFYKSDGTVLAVISELSDLKDIKIDNFEVEDGYVVDSIDVSKEKHEVIAHITPMATASKVEKQGEAITRIEKSLMDLIENALDDGSGDEQGEQ
nr:MAG TPA: hypothetical protein [Caudoviricetes sp.]